MGGTELDELFRRFVRRGDADAVGELFDQTAPQLARVAWHLTHDAGNVEDLVQATFLTALDRAREFDGARPVMPWLLGILVNHARNSRRAAGRKHAELASEPIDARTPDVEVERRELRDIVERAIHDLPDTYRDVVATWLVEGGTPSSIARAMNKPASTVRVQLHRGLELLRRGLPAGAAGLAAGATLSPRSLASAREHVIVRAAELAERLARATPSATLTGAGALLVIKWLAASAAIICVVLGARSLVHTQFPQRIASVDARSSDVELAAASSSESMVHDGERHVVDERRVESIAAAAPAQRPGWWLVGDIDGIADGAAAHISSTSSGFDAEVSGAHYEIDVSPFFADRKHPPRSLTLRYDHPRYVPEFEVLFPAQQVDLDLAYASARVELRLDFAPTLASTIVTGSVIAPEVIEATNVAVTLAPFGDLRSGPGLMEQTFCRANHSFRVRSAARGPHALVVALPGWLPATRHVDDLVGEVDVGVIELQRGEHIAGFVSPSSRREHVRATVDERTAHALSIALRGLPPTGVPPQLVWRDQRLEWEMGFGAIDERGRFRVDGLAPRAYRLTIEGEPDSDGEPITRLSAGIGTPPPAVTASADGIELARQSCRIVLDVRADGLPATDVVIGMSAAIAGESLDDFDATQCSSMSNLFEINWGGGPIRVSVSKEGWSPQRVTLDPKDATPGTVRVVELARGPELATLELRPIGECGLEGTCSITLEPLERDLTSSMHKRFDVQTRPWSFDGVVPGRYRVHWSLLPPSDATSWCVRPQLEIEIGRSESAVRELEFVHGGKLALTVRDARASSARVGLSDSAGQHPQVAWKSYDSSTGTTTQRFSSWTAIPVGTRFELASPLAPEAYELEVVLNDGSRESRKQVMQLVPGEMFEVTIDFAESADR